MIFSTLFQLLKNIPFHVLFINAWCYSGDRSLATLILKSTISNMNKYQLSCAFLFTLQHLSIIVKNESDQTFKTSANFILQILQYGLERISEGFKDAQDQLEFKTIIMDHYAFKKFNTLIMQLFYDLCESKFDCDNLKTDVSYIFFLQK